YRVLARVHRHREAIRLRELWMNLPPIVHGAPPSSLGNQPLRIVSFDCDGNYSSFCPELRGARSERFNDFVMGNVFRDELSQLPHNEVYLRTRSEIAVGLAKCREQCEYWKFCGGGEPSSKFFEHGRFDVTETATCRIHKMATIDAIVS